MAEIKVEWRRTIQTAPYESESCHLGYTETYQPRATDPVDQAKEIALVEGRCFMELARIGDQAIATRRKAYGK